MKVLVVTSSRIMLHEGKYYADRAYKLVLDRFYKFFGRLTVYCKTSESNIPTQTHVELDADQFSVLCCGSTFDLMIDKNKKLVEETIEDYDLLVVRVPSLFGDMAARIAQKKGIPYLCEVVGCAWDATWNYDLRGKMIAFYSYSKMKHTLQNADYATYVTKDYLEKKYPCKCKYTYASNVEIECGDKNRISERIQLYSMKEEGTLRLMTTAAVNVRYKGQEYVIKAIPGLIKRGIAVEYYVVGGGDNSYLKSVAEKCGVSEQVVFTGPLPRERVFELLNETDVYIQPSLQEGLPRALVEAMSCGCMSMGSRTAGIPELIDSEYIFERKDVKGIILQIEKYYRSSAEEKSRLMKKMFDTSQQYTSDILNERRNDYYCYVRDDLLKKNLVR